MSDSQGSAPRAPIDMEGVRVLAYVFGALGALGLLAGLAQMVLLLTTGRHAATNPVFANARRLPHLEALAQLVTGYGVSFAIMLAWSVLVVALGVLLVAIAHALHRRAPLASLMAGAFFGGSVVVGLLIGTSVLKVAEFGVQSLRVAPAEQEWLAAGVNFMNQLHLFYVSGWMLCIGLGWAFAGTATLPARGRTAGVGSLLFAAGSVVILSALARAWLPNAGLGAGAGWVALGEPLATLGVAAGLLGSALLALELRRRGARDVAGPASDRPLIDAVP